MAKRLILFLILFLSVNSIAAIHVAVLETIAEKDVIGQSEKLFLTDKLRERAKAVLPAHMGFTVMTRENINAMLPPGKSIEECEGSCLVETGKNIAADYVAQARVGKFGDQLTLTLELYETAGNNLVESFTTRKPNAEGLLEEIEQNQADRVFVQIVKAVETSDITKEETKSSKEKAPKQKKTSTETPANKVSSNLGEMVDKRNGKKYKTVTMGKLTWMAENLNYWTSHSTCYNNTESMCKKYGRLYEWDAAKTACPKGWHLPSKQDFEALLNAVGGQPIAGKALRSKTGWNSGKNGTDYFSFSAFPAGYKDEKGSFNNEGVSTTFWTSTDKRSKANSIHLDSKNVEAKINNSDKQFGYSVRCVKD